MKKLIHLLPDITFGAALFICVAVSIAVFNTVTNLYVAVAVCGMVCGIVITGAIFVIRYGVLERAVRRFDDVVQEWK